MEAMGDYLSHKSMGKIFCPELVLKYAREICRCMSEKKLVRKETGRSKKTRGYYGLKVFGKEKKMHYVIGDIHNEAKKLQSILNQIKIKPQDSLIVLGDIFDRGGTEADPVEVYFMLSGIQGELTWIRGNHDQWLADYVQKYYAQSERKRRKMAPYAYNTFEMMRKRLTQADMLHIAEQIQQLPLQKEMMIEGKSYLFAHAMTSHPAVIHKRGYYLMGNSSLDYYFLYGIDATFHLWDIRLPVVLSGRNTN